jgi:hypothetical protein
MKNNLLCRGAFAQVGSLERGPPEGLQVLLNPRRTHGMITGTSTQAIGKYKNLHGTSREPTSTGTSKHLNHSVPWEHENIKG